MYSLNSAGYYIGSRTVNKSLHKEIRSAHRLKLIVRPCVQFLSCYCCMSTMARVLSKDTSILNVAILYHIILTSKEIINNNDEHKIDFINLKKKNTNSMLPKSINLIYNILYNLLSPIIPDTIII